MPHTHWDREWYLPFQAFRGRLVSLVDGLLDEMERDPRVRFTLDGQTATVDDYLEIRPEAEPRIARLVRGGRLAVGPWAILMDEFLVSGETIVRNLEAGLRRARELGRAMPVGYLPDMFGHIAQMPQLLARAGIADAVVWRGVPHAIDGHVFTWRSPDGSEVRCEYLYRGYGQARDLFDLDARIERKLDVYTETMIPWFGGDEILAMYGEDHSLPMEGYARAVEDLNTRQDRYEVRIETLAEYVAGTRAQSVPTRTWTGELRSGARANVLMGVASHRIEVKQAAARAERWLERRAEPLAALHGREWPERALELAWRRVIECSAHDSICACSCEETVQQVLARYAEAEQIARALVESVLRDIAAQAPEGGWVAWNPSPARHSALVELSLPVAGPGSVRQAGSGPLPTQVLGIEAPVLDERVVACAEIVGYLRSRMHARELYTYLVNGFELEPPTGARGHATLTVDVSKTPDPHMLDVDALLADLDRTAATADAATPGASWRLRIVARPQRRLLVQTTVPALGWTALVPGPGAGEAAAGNPVVATARGLANGLVAVHVAADGTLSVEGSGVVLSGIGRIVDGGDAGDSYNYAPPASDVLVDAPSAVGVEVVETGPLRGILSIVRRYAWPVGLAEDGTTRSREAVDTDVVLRVELRAGEPFVRLAAEFDNRSRDHRVRFHVPLPHATSRSWAEGQFAVVERGLSMEGGHGEHPLPTFPAHGFAAADGAVVLLDHPIEFELVDGRELAVTLLRATGLISRDRHPWRAEPAGPVIEAPTGQGIGRRVISFALLPHRGRPGPEALDALEGYRNDLMVWRAGGASDLLARDTPGIEVAGDGVVLTALRRQGEALEVRLVNESDSGRQARITGPFAAIRDADLLGRPTGDRRPAGGVAELALGPWEVRTVLLLP